MLSIIAYILRHGIGLRSVSKLMTITFVRNELEFHTLTLGVYTGGVRSRIS